MAKKLELGLLNVVSSPHPDGVYLKILNWGSSGKAQARGSDYAKITKPKDEGNNLYSGRILLWTEIDMDSPWLDVDREDELSDELRNEINIPGNAKPNYRPFWYVFDASSHTMYFEMVNEFGESLGSSTAHRAISKLLASDQAASNGFDVEVTVIPEEDAVRQILDMPGLRKLFIRIKTPNPDDFEAKKREVLGELNEVGAKQIDLTYTKAAGVDRLTPNEEVEQLAQIGAENGYVKGESNVDGQPDELSTKAFPKKVVLPMEKGAGVLARILGYVRNQGRGRGAERA